MAYFHYRCGERITLLNDSCTAVRNDNDFDHGLVITAEPLVNDVLFEIKIDRKVNSWSGSLEIGVTECDPINFEFLPCASRLQNGTWIMTSNSVLKDGGLLVERYGIELDTLNQDDRVGVMRTSEGDLIFYINGDSQGVAAENLPTTLYGVVDLYGKCVQVTITNPIMREHNNDDCLSGSSVLAIDNDILNVTLGADLSELSLSSSNSLDIRMDMNVSINLPEEYPRSDKLRFHERCGSLVKLSNGHRSAERRRPLDEFNNGVVMTHRSLRDDELFEIRIDRLVDKWSGSIEMGVTTHNPSSLTFPATMTNMRSGTIMMSGCGILTNGKGTRREYGDFNLDELSEGDRVGMIRKINGDLHYFINGSDQGVAAHKVPCATWGVIDLYGMTIKVSIVERDEREEHNLNLRRNTRLDDLIYPAIDAIPISDYYDRLTFHPNCGAHAQVINNGRTALRPNAAVDFNNGVVLTSHTLKFGELFEVRLERVVTKWAGSIEIGVTTHSPTDLEFPFTMTNVRSGTWMMTGSGVMHNGTTILEQYGVNLDRLQVGDRVGVVHKEGGLIHFFVNGVDQGIAATNVSERVYGVIDLYGQAVEAVIVDIYDNGSPDTMHSSVSHTIYSDLRFHHVHGKNARIINNGQTAVRPRPLAEFNDAIVFSNRPLRDGELFEVLIENMVDRWSGSIEIGVTAARPEDIELPSTATDLTHDTWMLSGSSVMENGTTIKNSYGCDLDMLTSGVRIGVMRSSEKTLEFYKDGVPQGIACSINHINIYAVVDLYGQCAQVSIPCISPIAPLASLTVESCPRSETSASLQGANILQPPNDADRHKFHECHGMGVTLSESGRIALRGRELKHCIVFGATPLVQDELFEFTLLSLASHYCGTIRVGITLMSPSIFINSLPLDCCYITGNEVRWKNKIVQQFTPNLNWLRIGDHIGLIKIHDGCVKIFINNEELHVVFPNIGDNPYIVLELAGSCTAVAVSSRRVPLSPVTTVRLQDSLELALEATFDTDVESLKAADSSIHYEFHENHGRNIELIADRIIARRVASYNQGLVIVQPALQPGQSVKILLEQLDVKWSSSLMVGIIGGAPERLNLPVTALAIKCPSCIIANDWISVNGVKTKSNYNKLSSLTPGTNVTIALTDNNLVQLYIDDVPEEPIQYSMPNNGIQFYAVFDLYGQCQQIKIINKIENVVSSVTPLDFEKADLESCEKEFPDTNLSLSLPLPSTTSVPTSSYQQKNTPTPQPYKPCMFEQECESYKKMLLLPDEFFTLDDPTCYCNSCCGTVKDEQLKGWVKFPLRNLNNIQTDKWHVAYYGTKVGFVRSILDRGQPLSKGQEQWGNLVCQKTADLQIVFNPSLQNCIIESFKLDDIKDISAAFQLLVKPGAYSISRDLSEWSTKETGAIVLNALLINCHL